MANFLTLPIFQDVILPFLLIFVLLYAILEKTRLLGEDKHQINAITALVIAGILIAFASQITWIKQFMVFLVIALIILFVFMLIYGFAYAGKEGFALSNKLKITIATLAFIAVVFAGLIITGYWNAAFNFFTGSTLGANIVFGVIIAVVIVAVLVTGKKKHEEK
jgi:hypothetical protein